ncbi:MAG: secretion system X translation initiation factor [Rugosibacter sp.]|nr:secretion system X translation initiation factor [Rugosibacter sp.]
MSTTLSPTLSSTSPPKSPPKWSLRNMVLGIALVATIIASVVDFPAADAPEPTPQKTLNSAGRPDLPTVVETTTVREQYATQAGDLFASHSWQPPPPPPPKPAAPKAPPLPFLYLGKVLEGGEILVFLGQGTRTHLLRRGDVLAEYKIDEITPTEITFVYLPLNQKQHLTFGSAN